MTKIGILGEHPDNDANAIKRLIERNYADRKDLKLIVLIKNLRGNQLDGKNGRPAPKLLKLLKLKFKTEKLNFIIAIRDLDDLPSQEEKIREKENWFKILDKEAANGKGLFFLAIYELESVILADIETFNKMYKVKMSPKGNPMYIQDPKGKLASATKKAKKTYKEAHSSEIFEKINIETARSKHKGKRSLDEFFIKLDKKLKK